MQTFEEFYKVKLFEETQKGVKPEFQFAKELADTKYCGLKQMRIMENESERNQ